jgi:hypothetical protein
MSITYIFIYLQLLDLLTTFVGFKMGAAEASPFIRALMHLGPGFGVAASKVLALGLGGLCVYTRREHIIKWISVWYAGLIVWNLMVVLTAPGVVRAG